MALDPGAPRYARQRVLPGWGVDAQRRLADARVVVLGAGGLGSFVVPALVAAGVGTVVVVDDDDVDVTNLHRQLLHAPGDVGRLKVESAADAAFDLSPDTNLVPAAIRFDETVADELLAGADLVVDGTDDILTRYSADDAATRAGIPLVWGSAAKFSGQVGGSGNRSRYETPRASHETPTWPENFAADPQTSGMPARAAASSAA